MVIIACSRIFCSIIVIFLGLLFLILPAYHHHHHHHHHASVGSFGGYPDYDHHHASGVVGGHVLRRKMIAAGPHASPTSPGNLQKLYTRRPPSLGTKTKSTTLYGTTDDVTKTKMGISSTGTGKHKDRESGLAATPPRRQRRRRLISATPSNSQPSPGYREHAVP